VAFVFLPECIAGLGQNVRLTPLAGRFGEYLDRRRPNHLASERCHLNATLARNMGAETLWLTKLMHPFLCNT
jgi:hypothetical protein